MFRTTALAACLSAVVSMGSGAAFAAPVPQELTAPPPPELTAPPPPLAPMDWRDFIDTDMNGDHVVGEELCAAPGMVESVPESFVFI